MSPKWYPVYKVKFNIALADPDMPPGRLHHALFVERHSDGSGYLYHVTGDITSSRGMSYQKKKKDNPSGSQSFHSRELLGYTQAKSEVWDTVLSSLPTPPQQKASNPNNGGKVEPFKEKSVAIISFSTSLEKPANHFGNVQESSSAGDSSAAETGRVWDEQAQAYMCWDATSGQWLWEEQE